MIQSELRIDISQRKIAEAFRTVEIHLRKSSREIFRAKTFHSEISLTFFSLEIGLNGSANGSAKGSAIGHDQSHKVRKIANEQGKGCGQSYNVNFS